MSNASHISSSGRPGDRPEPENIAAIPVGPAPETPPEYGRIEDVLRIYGLKRSSIYNLLKDGRIKGCVLRFRGRRSRVRLIDLGSVRDFIRSNMNKGGIAQ